MKQHESPKTRLPRHGLSEGRTALVAGIVAAAVYVIWALAVGIGGQHALNLLMGMELFRLPAPTRFSLGVPLAGLVANFLLGAFAGWLFAWLWNRLKV
jgi:hypothetical protein